MGQGSSLGAKAFEKKSKLAQVRGDGSSHRGVKEWLLTRILSLFSLPLTIYILIAILQGNANSYNQLHAWIVNPFNVTVLVLAIITICWHGTLGLISVINDYVQSEGMNFFLRLLFTGVLGFIMVFSIISILFIII